MPLYQVMFDVASGETGQLTKGEHVELDKDVADWLNGQAEGALKPKAAKSADPNKET